MQSTAPKSSTNTQQWLTFNPQTTPPSSPHTPVSQSSSSSTQGLSTSSTSSEGGIRIKKKRKSRPSTQSRLHAFQAWIGGTYTIAHVQNRIDPVAFARKSIKNAKLAGVYVPYPQLAMIWHQLGPELRKSIPAPRERTGVEEYISLIGRKGEMWFEMYKQSRKREPSDAAGDDLGPMLKSLRLELPADPYAKHTVAQLVKLAGLWNRLEPGMEVRVRPRRKEWGMMLYR